MIDERSTLVDIAFAVCTALDTAEIEAVLCGGSAANYYSERYQSYDADFVLSVATGADAIDEALRPIGFRRNRSNMYAHPKSTFTVEFPAGPLTIGRKIIRTWNTQRRDAAILRVISAEDCICDRFLHFWAWRDSVARSVALAVAESVRTIDVSAIVAWARDEMAADPLYDASVWDDFRIELEAIG